MNEKRKMSLVPPNTKQRDKLKAFIEEPELKTKEIEPEPEIAQEIIPEVEEQKPEMVSEPVNLTEKVQYPWEAQGVTPEIIKNVMVRVAQPDKLKIDYIVEHSLDYKSIHDFFIKAVLKQLKEESKKMGL